MILKIHKEIMDYSRLKRRIFTGTVFVIFFLIILFFNKFLFIFTTIIYCLILLEIFLNFNKKNILFLYVLISFISFHLYFFYNFNIIFFIYVSVLIILFDSFSYFFGSFFGYKKILPQISPNKTYEGLILGYIFSLITVFPFFINLFAVGFFMFILISTILIVFAFIGDLIQSYYKRQSNIKDSSSLLPGHGGFFDRFDSFILVLIFINPIQFFFK